MFLFKSKKVVVDCFTREPVVAQNYPIKKSFSYVPEWWRNLEQCVHHRTQYAIARPSPTMKTCTGFINLFQKTWTIPLWTDFILQTRSDGNYDYLFPNPVDPSHIGSHPSHQHQDGMRDRIHVKITPPWILWEKTGIHFVFFGADWTLMDELPSVRVVPGIVNYRDQHGSAVNFFVDKKDARLEFRAGTPMVYLAPMTDKKVEFKVQVVDEQEWSKLEKHKAVFLNKFITRGKWK